MRKKVYCSAVKGLKKGGVFILEAYSPRQLEKKTGGRKEAAMLYDLEEVKKELAGLSFEIAQEVERDIIEGDTHTGKGSVIQVLAGKF